MDWNVNLIALLKNDYLVNLETISLVFLFLGTIFAAGIIDVDLSNIAWQGWVFGFSCCS